MKFSKAGVGRAAVAAGLLLLVPVGLLAQSDGERRRAVGDWLVEDAYEQDGRVIRLTREEGDYRIRYDIILRYGETAPSSHGFEVDRLNCAQGMSESTGGNDDTPVQAAPIRARLVEYLERCDAPSADVANLLQGFERAFALARSWTDERLAETSPETNAAAYTDDMALDMNATDMAMDMGATADMNATYSETNMEKCGCESDDLTMNAMDDAAAAAEAALNAADAAMNTAEPN